MSGKNIKLFLILTSFFLLSIFRVASAEIEPNNTYLQATALSLNLSDTGALNEAAQNLDADNYDWWKVILPGDGRLYFETNSSSGLDIDLIIIDGNGATYLSYGSTRGSTRETVFTNNLLAGTYYVLVSRYSGGGSYSIRSEFTQTAYTNDSEPNDLYTQGIVLNPNSSSTGHLGFLNASKTDIYDFWKITIPGDGVFTIETTSDATLDIDLTIYDGNGSNYLAYGTQRGSVNESASDHLLAGVYYVLAQRYTGYGSYTIRSVFTAANLANDTEPNDTYSQGIILLPNSTSTGHLGFYNAAKTDIYDYWKIVLPDDGVLAIETTSDATLDVDLTIYDGNGVNYLAYGTTRSSVTEKASDHFIAGTYYVQAQRYTGYGSYSIKSVFTKAALEDDAEPNDISSQAINLGPNTTDTGHLGYYNAGKTDNYDYWKVTVPSDGKLSIETNSDATLDVDLTLYDINGSSYINIGTTRNNTKETVSVNNLMPGTYFVLAYRYTGYGSYEIKSAFTATAYTNDAEPNDQMTQAKTIAANTLMTGHLGFYSNGFTDEQDYYVITLPTNWDSLYVRTDSDASLDIDLGLYLNSSSTLQYVSVRGNTKEILGYKNALASTPYYIKVYKYSGYGSYGIKVSSQYPRNTVTAVRNETPDELPSAFELSQNFPNPFNPFTNIIYSLPENSFVSIKIYDLLGREVRNLINSVVQAGKHSVMWKGDDNSGYMVSSGTYIYKIQSGNFIQSKKMTLIK